jgi:hypothetical protein
MTRPTISKYEQLSFQEVTQIIYYHYSDRAGMFKELMEDLLTNSEEPYKSISPRQYEEYKQYLTDNKNSK